ncbi:hypothetical protein PR048_011001 [Dryococelus australis]|uniref:Uncharacterized protein n=1 Tax=Dryococelus australis TaxID=614101 RepID=A0ABQ9HKC4_9NEOP|nr:hypothetical protein PR048_011001 [Dryococelus australis]
MVALIEPHMIKYLDFIDDDLEEENDDDVQRPRRYLRDNANTLEHYSGTQFQARYRFSKDTVRFRLLPILLMEEPQHKRVLPLTPNQQLIVALRLLPILLTEEPQHKRGLPLTPIQQLLVPLRFYATGSFQER